MSCKVSVIENIDDVEVQYHFWDKETLLKGRIERYGKHEVKFINKGAKRTIICAGELTGTKLRVFTIEEGN